MPTRTVLLTIFDILRDQPTFYGYQLCNVAGLEPGVVYPILLRLKDHGWLTSEWGDPDPQRPGHGVRRRYYRLTDKGAVAARLRLNPKQET